MYALISKLCFFRSLCYVCGLYSNLREKKNALSKGASSFSSRIIGLHFLFCHDSLFLTYFKINPSPLSLPTQKEF